MRDGTYLVGMNDNGKLELVEPIIMSDGYWVADESGVSVHGTLDKRGIVDALSLMEVESGEIIGIWESEGISYIDRSYHFKSKDTAIKVAKVFEQKAIFDCYSSEEVEV